mgnify:CR=1 FL=1|jgi:type II secretory pathway pseudopilin PulG
MEQQTHTPDASAQKGNGPVIGIIIVIIVLAIGAYYLFSELSSQEKARQASQNVQEVQTQTDNVLPNVNSEQQFEEISEQGAEIETNL